jgi:hypothetical protein
MTASGGRRVEIGDNIGASSTTISTSEVELGSIRPGLPTPLPDAARVEDLDDVGETDDPGRHQGSSPFALAGSPPCRPGARRSGRG